MAKSGTEQNGPASMGTRREMVGLVDRGGRNGLPAFGQSDPGTTDNRPARIFIVEDDPVMLRMVADYLEQHNMHAVPASGRQEMIRYFTTGEPDLVILDLRLGQEDGFDLLREIRSCSEVPVIITTGDRRDEIDRVVGLELGADDYVTKPFSLRELLARVRAVLRRQETGRALSSRDTERGRCKFGGWQLERRTRRLTDPNGTEVALTKGEYALLTAFLDAPQRPLSREHLLRQPACMRISLTAASTSRPCDCGASWKPTRAHRASSEPSAASAMCLACRSSAYDARITTVALFSNCETML
jgi:two-component system, OmpR family, response regulator